MTSAAWRVLSYFILILALSTFARAQTVTYHLHSEFTTTTNVAYQLRTSGPDAAVFSRSTINLKNASPGEYKIVSWETQPGTPNASGLIPSGSTVTFVLWMKKTANAGTMYPRAKLFLNDDFGTNICTVTGATALTTTLTQYTLSSTTSSAIQMTNTDRYSLWVGVNLTAGANSNLLGEIDVEGALNGNYDSRITVPLPSTPPTINSLTPSSGPTGTSVTVGGANFGATQGSSTITFSGAAATPTSWSAGSVVAPVPTSATTGPVVVTVAGVASNGVSFTLLTTGSISGTVSKASDGVPISGALIEALQSSMVKASATTGVAGTYMMTGLIVGTYDVRVSGALGYITQSQNGLIVTAGSSTTANFGLTSDASAIKYIYDELGRLVGVVDPSGDAATYRYDAVGNTLSISRLDSTSVSVIEFTPNSGPPSASVTIYGIGFSATPNQNTVQFNGVAATVISASTTQILTIVPPGATTGPITVTAPSGSATSSAPFVVSSFGGAPTITGLSPSVGVPGSIVTVNGTNFETTPMHNRVTLNLTDSIVNSASALTLAVSISSSATSGRISVATPYGEVASTQDFFIAPPPYTAADVEITGRMAVGETRTVTINAAGKIGLILFEGTAGQHVSLSLTNVTISFGYIHLYNLDGTLATTTTLDSAFIDWTLPTTATYQLHIDPNGTFTGSVTLTLREVPADVIGTITPGGAPVSTSIATSGQNARLTFNGIAGQQVSLRTTSAPATEVYQHIYTPAGKELDLGEPNWPDYYDRQVLPVTGAYTILLNPLFNWIGTLTSTLYLVPPDSTGTITVGGPTVTVATPIPGQNASLTYEGTAGQRLVLSVSTAFTSYREPYLDFDFLSAESINMYVTSGDFGPYTLPTSGPHNIFMNPQRQNTGNTFFTLRDLPPDVTGTITVGGTPVTVTTTAAFQNARLSFDGTTGQRVSLKTSSVTITSSNVSILNADGQSLGSIAVGTTGGFLDSLTLPADGTYSILIDPQSTYTGSMTLTLYNVPPDVTGVLTPNGSSVNVTLATPGQNGRLTFSGASGQQITVKVTGNNIDSVTVSLLSPSGSTLTSSSSSSHNLNLATQTLSANGTYTVLINPPGANIGSLSVKVTSP